MEMQALMSRYRVAQEELPATVAVEPDVLSRFRRADDIGSSLADNKLLGAAPIPTGPIHKTEVRSLTEEQLAVELKKPLQQMAREALAMLGGRDYLVRTGLYDHRTFIKLLTSLEPKTVELNAGESLYALVCASMREPKTIEGEVVNG